MKHHNLAERVIKMILLSDLKELAKLSVNLIARKFDVNPDFLSRKFKEDTDFLLSDYIKLEKIRQAEKLLETRNDLNIADIAEMLGFSKPEYFRKYFKKKNILKPHEYRLLYKK